MVKKWTQVSILVIFILVVGFFVFKSTFDKGEDSVQNISVPLQDEINSLFSNDSLKFVVYPSSREVRLKKGNSGGIGFSMRNTYTGEAKTFAYSVYAKEIQSGCGLSLGEANSLITEKGTGKNIVLAPKERMKELVIIKFSTPKTAHSCVIKYNIDTTANDEFYGKIDFDLKIIS